MGCALVRIPLSLSSFSYYKVLVTVLERTVVAVAVSASSLDLDPWIFFILPGDAFFHVKYLFEGMRDNFK